jgi:hypothetical protein
MRPHHTLNRMVASDMDLVCCCWFGCPSPARAAWRGTVGRFERATRSRGLQQHLLCTFLLVSHTSRSRLCRVHRAGALWTVVPLCAIAVDITPAAWPTRHCLVAFSIKSISAFNSSTISLGDTDVRRMRPVSAPACTISLSLGTRREVASQTGLHRTEAPVDMAQPGVRNERGERA